MFDFVFEAIGPVGSAMAALLVLGGLTLPPLLHVLRVLPLPRI